jgi:hypothetical protein
MTLPFFMEAGGDWRNFMGFGWMFLGYCLLLGTNIEFLGVPLDVTPDVIAFLLMLKGFGIANGHCESFRIPRVFAMIGVPLSLLVTALDLFINMKVITLSVTLAVSLSWAYDIFKLAYNLVLLYAIYLISTEVGVDKLRKKAARCAIYSVIFFFLAQSSAVVFSWFGITLSATYVSAIAMLADALCIVINATLVFGCYMRICLEGDEDMPDNREHKYKTPFDYFERRQALDAAEKAKQKNVHHHKKKK